LERGQKRESGSPSFAKKRGKGAAPFGHVGGRKKKRDAIRLMPVERGKKRCESEGKKERKIVEHHLITSSEKKKRERRGGDVQER